MRSFFGSAVSRAVKLAGKNKEEIAYEVLPTFLLEIIKRYLRVKSIGLQHIPKDGPVIVISNHSGYMGFDALMLGYEIHKKKRRVPRIIAHKLWFLVPEISVHAKKLGLIPATFENGLKILKKRAALILFPEGEEGNFKPTNQRYRLKRFRRGFVRLALTTGAPIVPAVVIGAEESHITLSQIRWAKHLLGIIVPLPLNVVPIPVKWKIRFLKPIRLKKDLELAANKTYVTKLSREIRANLQKQLNEELKKRKSLFT